MTERLEKRFCVMFCTKLNDNQAEATRYIQTASGDDAMDMKEMKIWYNRLKERHTSVERGTLWEAIMM